MKTIDQVLKSEYGVSIVSSPAYAIVWAAEKLEPIEFAKAELKRAHDIRHKQGMVCLNVPFGHKLF